MWSKFRNNLKLLSESSPKNDLNSSSDSAYQSSPDCPNSRRIVSPQIVIEPNDEFNHIEVIGLKGKTYNTNTRGGNSNPVPWLSRDIGDTLRDLKAKQNDRPLDGKQCQTNQIPNRRIRRFGPRPVQSLPKDNILRQNLLTNHEKSSTNVAKLKQTKQQNRMRTNPSSNIITESDGQKKLNLTSNGSTDRQKDGKGLAEKLNTEDSIDSKIKSNYKTETFFTKKQQNGIISTKSTIKRVVIFDDGSDLDID